MKSNSREYRLWTWRIERVTTSVQESTSSGGLEKPQTPKQIAIGVSASLDTLSPSISLRIKEITLSRLLKYHRFRLKKYTRKTREGFELFSHDMEEECYTNPEKWAWELIRKIAIVRFFEIWGKKPVSNEAAFRGLGEKEDLRSSISGMISTLSQEGAILPKDGKWLFNHGWPKTRGYSFREDLQSEAIESCKQLAETLAQNKKNANDKNR